MPGVQGGIQFCDYLLQGEPQHQVLDAAQDVLGLAAHKLQVMCWPPKDLRCCSSPICVSPKQLAQVEWPEEEVAEILGQTHWDCAPDAKVEDPVHWTFQCNMSALVAGVSALSIAAGAIAWQLYASG